MSHLLGSFMHQNITFISFLCASKCHFHFVLPYIRIFLALIAQLAACLVIRRLWVQPAGSAAFLLSRLIMKYFLQSFSPFEVVGWCEDVVYLTSPGRPTDIGLHLGKACYPCSR